MNLDFAIVLLESDEPERIKRGLQTFCELLEAGGRVPSRFGRDLYTAISRFKGCGNPIIRRWLFKLIGLLRERSLVPFLLGELHSDHLDHESQTWALAALANLTNSIDELEREVRPRDLGISRSVFLLSSSFLSHKCDQTIHLDTKAILTSGDSVAGKWMCLHYGSGLLPIPKNIITELNTHPDNEVAEFSLWALWKSREGAFQDTRIYPQDINRHAGNVRRWYLRLLMKDVTNLRLYHDLVAHTIKTETEFTVREAVAKGVLQNRYNPSLAAALAEWYGREESDLVRALLAQYFTKHAHRNAAFAKLAVHAQLEDPSVVVHGLGNGRKAAGLRATVSRTNNRVFRPLERNDMDLPEIKSTDLHQTYLLGVDTVDFSSKCDEDQLVIFKDILNVFKEELRQLDAASAIEGMAVPLTGDGLFLVIRGDRARFVPLQAALAIRRRQTLRTYQLRYGIHIGPATWVSLTDQSTQIIGHAINWTARIVNAAAGNEILMSTTYHDQVIVPTDRFGYLRFEEKTGLATKKGESISARAVLEQA